MAAFERFSQLWAPRQALVRLFQSVNSGLILGVTIHNGDPVFHPVFHPEPTLFLDVKLDADEMRTKTRGRRRICQISLSGMKCAG
jgi:hypothetical protein